MTVGLPGVGLGGVFYLLSAVLMPVREAVRFAKRTETRRARLVVRQSALAGGILVALWATGWALGHLIKAASHGPAAGLRYVPPNGNALRVGALVLSLGTLALVLTMVQIARLVVRIRRYRRVNSPRSLAAPAVAESVQALRIDSGTFSRSR